MDLESFNKRKEFLENFLKDRISFKDNTVIENCLCFYSNNIFTYDEYITEYIREKIKGFLMYLNSFGRSNGQSCDILQVFGKENICLEYFPILLLKESDGDYTTEIDDCNLFDVEPFNIVICVSYKLKKQIINAEKIFKENECVICFKKEPKIIFCNCGHQCVCKECWRLLDDRNHICVICRKRNDIIRII